MTSGRGTDSRVVIRGIVGVIVGRVDIVVIVVIYEDAVEVVFS